MSHSLYTRPIDASIARLLYQLPHYQAWDQVNLAPEIREVLDESEQQQLMCIVAYSLGRLMLSEQEAQGLDCA